MVVVGQELHANGEMVRIDVFQGKWKILFRACVYSGCGTEGAAEQGGNTHKTIFRVESQD